MCIAQNGPGITNFVTGLRCSAHPRAQTRTRAHTVLSAGVAAAYWAHSPVTPRGSHSAKRTPRVLTVLSAPLGVLTVLSAPLGVLTVLSAGVAAAYWAHSPVVCITPEAGSATKGYGGFQVL